MNAEFVYRMEAILDEYAQPADPLAPRGCFDETSKQLVAETRTPRPGAPGHPALTDYEYRRNGTANLFMLCAPRLGWRHVAVTERRTAHAVALQLQALAEEHFPNAPVIHLIWDNLNTHTLAVLYTAFAPAAAQRLAARFVVHPPPKHASWLNQAELELAALTTQCLDRRLPDHTSLTAEVAAWEADRNAARTTIRWDFDVDRARTKLARLYPHPHVS